MYSPKTKILKVMLLEETGRQKEAITLINKELRNTTKKATNYILALKIIRMISYYGIGRYKKCTREFYALLNNKKYNKLYEYGFVLRGAELALPYKDSLPYFVKSIKHFKRFGAEDQAAISRITYAVHLGLVGRLKQAVKQISIAKMIVSKLPTSKHVLLNDQAVLLLFQKNTSQKVGKMFKEALATATLDFDRVAILVNYLVLMDWKNNDAGVHKAIKAIEKILRNPSFANKEIIRYAYFDIYKYYERKKQRRLALKYLNKIDSLHLPVTPIWDFFLNGKPISMKDKEYVRARINRAISYLTCWNIDVDSILRNYK